jgi:ribonuclease J
MARLNLNTPKKYAIHKKVAETTIESNLYKKTDTLVYALGGLGEVGKNMYCFQHDDEIVVVDSGIKFPGEDLPGVDYVIPDYSHLIANKEKVKVLVITHGHLDHIGGIPFLLQVIPLEKIYAPRFAKSLIEGILEERKMLDKVKIIEINDESRIKTKHFSIGFFETVHSIPDSYGILVNTPNGRIVETGDFKFDLTPVGTNSDYQKMAYSSAIGVTLLMSDSTNSSVNGFSISEKAVAKSILEITKKTPGRLIVSSFSSNVNRMSQIVLAGIKSGRKIAVFGRSMDNALTISRKLKTINVSDDNFIKANDIDKLPPNKVLIICTGSQGEPLAALSRIANGTHRQVRIKPGDTVVFSSSAIPGNELSISTVVNKLTRLGAVVMENSPLNSLHTTGHASKEEQELMLQLIKPKYFMPVHGEYKMLKTHMETAIETGVPRENCFICSNGDVLALRDETVFNPNFRFQADSIFVDGNDTSGVNTSVIRDRQVLSDSGLVAVIVSMDSRYNKILCKPTIVSRGFVLIKGNQNLINEAEQLVYNALNERMKEKTNFSEIKKTIRSTLEAFLYKKTKRNPIVIPVILNNKDAVAEMIANRSKKSKKKASV